MYFKFISQNIKVSIINLVMFKKKLGENFKKNYSLLVGVGEMKSGIF